MFYWSKNEMMLMMPFLFFFNLFILGYEEGHIGYCNRSFFREAKQFDINNFGCDVEYLIEIT